MPFKIFLLLYFVFSHYLSSQSLENSFVLGRVLDNNQLPLADVVVQDLESRTVSITDQFGQFKLQLFKGNRTLIYKKLGYTILQKSYQFNTDTAYILTYLNRKVKQLPAVEINFNKIQLAYKKPNAYIIDYEWLEEGILLILEENKQYKLRWIDEDDNTLLEKIISAAPEKFHRDCLDHLSILYRDSVYQIYINYNELMLLPGITRVKYDTLVLPCITAMKQNFYFQKFSNLNKAISYVVIDTISKDHIILQNMFQKESYYFAQSYLLSILSSSGYNINAMGNIDLGQLKLSRAAEERMSFFKNILSKPIYGPLFKVRDSIFVFDHTVDTSYVFDDSSNLVRKFPVAYHHKKGWKKELLVDPVSQIVYAKFINEGLTYLYAINTANGNINKIHKLEKHTFLNHIKVKDGYAYYIYREKMGNSFNYLYRQRLE